MNSVDELFRQLESKFSFPYFGDNWDSLLDLLSDFEWISAKDIYLINTALIALPRADFELYISVLASALERLSTYAEPKFHVLFPAELRPAIDEILAKQGGPNQSS